MGNAAIKLRGVNLGSWLVLEKWMVPSLFEGLAATDETTWCAELGAAAPERLRAHWQRWITREDFAWLAGRGINAVRIPVGHWIFGPDYPYHPSYGEARHPFVEGGIAVLDNAMTWAQEFGLHVVLDLHAAPGCQNGFDNGGIKDVCEWHTRPEYVDHSVEVLGRLAARYAARPALAGIEVLNEPRWDVPTEFLKAYYLRAYDAIRAHCRPQQVAVVFHDGFRSHREYAGFLQPPEFENVLFDVHRYQCFDRADLDVITLPGRSTKSLICHWQTPVANVFWQNTTPSDGNARISIRPYYRIESERAAMLCRAVCTQIAAELDADGDVAPDDRLTPRTAARR